MHPLLTGLIVTAIFVAGIAWQIATFLGDERTNFRRHVVATWIALALVVGAIGYCVLDALDAKELGLLGSVTFVSLAGIVGCLFVIKQAIGPVLLSSSTAWAVYRYIEHGEWELCFLISNLVDWVFSACPGWCGPTYLWITGIYACGSCLVSSATLFEDVI